MLRRRIIFRKNNDLVGYEIYFFGNRQAAVFGSEGDISSSMASQVINAFVDLVTDEGIGIEECIVYEKDPEYHTFHGPWKQLIVV